MSKDRMRASPEYIKMMKVKAALAGLTMRKYTEKLAQDENGGLLALKDISPVIKDNDKPKFRMGF